MKKYLKYFYNNDSINCIIEEDDVGFYLIVYDHQNPGRSIADYLFDSLEDVFQAAKEKFGILQAQWQIC